MDKFTYNVPECDFTQNVSNENHAEMEAYFDVKHEECNGFFAEVLTDDGFNSTFEESDGSATKDPLGASLRRSSSVGDLRNKIIDRDINDKSRLSKCTTSSNSFDRRKSISTQSLFNRPKKFVSVAEAINSYLNKTPDRFHTRSRSMKPVFNASSVSKTCTIPSSPFLATRQRVRALTVLSHDEREMKEAEEMLKFKIKALPLNPKILAAPTVTKLFPTKKLTIPEPFKITEVPKRQPVVPAPVIPQFHAQPVPKFLIPKPALTRSQTPIIMKHAESRVKSELKTKEDPPVRPKNTVVAPFSFLERDKGILKRKDEVIKKILECEKKNREFHATPLPRYISSTDGANSTLYKKNASVSSLKYSSTESLVQPIFKARPAKVLHMKPFEPKKEDCHVLEVAEFRLNTDLRAKDRGAFQSKLKEKEQLLEQYRQMKEKETLQKEEEEVRKLRKEAEYKAKPIRKYKKVAAIIQKELTIPVSPNFNRSRSNNKENLSS
ncbi:hypothetical protein RI129_006346 [Pyrocoelia pectoralis]|uniref:Targeting protein for Xklp2 n=1 Tax=Pyrocoelia pectoralis TaxID=417401 RepID=A0AAN7VH24_9COLE